MDGSHCCRDVSSVIRSPSDSVIGIIAVLLSLKGASSASVSCCADRQPNTQGAVAWCVLQRKKGEMFFLVDD